MPYLPPADRAFFDREIEAIPVMETKAELCYVISRLMFRFARESGKYGYQRMSDAVAASADAGNEFRRQVMDPYEDRKAADNGNLFHIYDSLAPR